MSNKIKQLKEAIKKEVTKVLNEAKSKKKKKMKFEGISVAESGHVELDEIGNFWVVKEAEKGSTDENIVFETDTFNFNEMLSQGKIKRESVKGIFREERNARKLSEKYLKERLNAVSEAKKRADELKTKFEGLKNELSNFKNLKNETQQAVKAINEKAKPEDKKKVKPEVKKDKKK